MSSRSVEPDGGKRTVPRLRRRVTPGMIVNRGTPSSTGGAKSISLLKEISMSQLGGSADDRANAQFSVMWAWSGPIGLVAVVTTPTSRWSCRLSPTGRSTTRLDVVVAEVLRRADARHHQEPRRLVGPCAQDHLAGGESADASGGFANLDTGGDAVARDLDPLGDGIGDDVQVVAVDDRFDERSIRALTLAVVDAQPVPSASLEVAVVEERVVPQAGLHGGVDEDVGQLVRLVRHPRQHELLELLVGRADALPAPPGAPGPSQPSKSSRAPRR